MIMIFLVKINKIGIDRWKNAHNTRSTLYNMWCVYENEVGIEPTLNLFRPSTFSYQQLLIKFNNKGDTDCWNFNYDRAKLLSVRFLYFINTRVETKRKKLRNVDETIKSETAFAFSWFAAHQSEQICAYNIHILLNFQLEMMNQKILHNFHLGVK